MTYTEENIANLTTYFVKGDENAPTVLLLHGYGANGRDLLSLSSLVQTNKNLNWIFPEGFIPIDSNIDGKAWFTIDWLLLEDLLQTGQAKDYSVLEPPGLQEAKNKILTLLNQLNLSLEQVILGGFSQGAMLGTEIALSAAIKPKSLLILSGTLVCKDRWERLAQETENLSFFQSHGLYDPVLEHKKGKQLYELLTQAGLKGNFYGFNGGHEIPPVIMKQLQKHLNQF